MYDFDRYRPAERRLLRLVDATHPADTDDLLKEVASAYDATDERVGSTVELSLIGGSTAGGAKASVGLDRSPALLAQTHSCSISHGVAGSNLPGR
jgi:hypothetical protein